MGNIVSSDSYGVTEKNGKPIVSSRYVSEIFHKRHDHVLRDIENITISLPKIGEVNWESNFQKSTYKDRGKRYPEVIMTRAGSLAEIRETLPPGLVCFGRDRGDDPCVVEVWC